MKLTTVYASSPTREGIEKAIAKFYCGEKKELKFRNITTRRTRSDVPSSETQYDVLGKDGIPLSTTVIETKRGFYFGVL